MLAFRSYTIGFTGRENAILQASTIVDNWAFSLVDSPRLLTSQYISFGRDFPPMLLGRKEDQRCAESLFYPG